MCKIMPLEEMIEKLKETSDYSIRFVDGMYCLNRESDGEIIAQERED